jgi:epoxide hydrolase-like predicted phosphatase
MSRFDAVLWDYGGIFTASPFGAAHAYARAQGVEPEDMVRVVFGSYDSDTDHAWHQLERGEISFVDALARIKADAESSGFRFDTGEMFSMMVTDEIDRTLVVEAVRMVRARGLRTAIVTNNIKEYGDAWRGQFPLDELFDAVVDSCEEGVRKPDPAIFRTALARLGVDDPTRAIFLDDFPGNVAAATALGMHGILVGDDPAPALDELTRLVST